MSDHIDRIRLERVKVRAELLRVEIKKLRAERDALLPVVEAAKTWARALDESKDDQDGAILDASNALYRALAERAEGAQP